MTVEVRRGMVDRAHRELSVVRQCQLLGIARATACRRRQSRRQSRRDGDLELMKLIDRACLAWPFYGWRRMTAWLRQQGHRVNHKRVRRLMQGDGP